MTRAAQDYTGHRFGRLVVTGEVLPRKSHRRMYVTCDCGTQKEVFLTSLKQDTQSCGCLHREVVTTHGMGNDKSGLYRVWINMHQRCYNENHNSFHDYGGRGVRVCDAWHDFVPFKAWAEANSYNPGLTIDRHDNGLLYCPESCRFTDRTAQQRNRRGQRGSSSQYIGVSIHSRSGQWQASIKIAGQAINLGQFDDEVAAAKARDQYIIDNKLANFTMNF